jgi:RimJ/RimL family protein N-acetyltransferase
VTLPWLPVLPILTERLELRAHTAGDLDDLLLFHSDPDVVRYIPWPVRTHEQVVEALDVKLSRFRAVAPGDVIVLAIVLRATGRVIGEVLLKCSTDDEAELGYALATEFHGRGIATEAAAAMTALGFDEFGVRRIVAVLDARNPASRRLLEKLGFALVREYEEEFKGELSPALEFELLRD